MVHVGESAILTKWTGSEWVDQLTVPAPSPVTGVQAIDVTGDGTGDFVVQMFDFNMYGGVFNPTGQGWDWLPFDDGTIFQPRLIGDHGILQSQVSVVSSPVSWTWTGSAFAQGDCGCS